MKLTKDQIARLYGKPLSRDKAVQLVVTRPAKIDRVNDFLAAAFRLSSSERLALLGSGRLTGDESARIRRSLGL